MLPINQQKKPRRAGYGAPAARIYFRSGYVKDSYDGNSTKFSR